MRHRNQGRKLNRKSAHRTAMFANMYATQAILPVIEHALNVSPAAAGLSITVVVVGVAIGGWVHGPLSDRIGRARVMVAKGPSPLLVDHEAPLRLVIWQTRFRADRL